MWPPDREYANSSVFFPASPNVCTRAGGINVHLSLFHGAEFATPPDLQTPATNGVVFRLYEKAEDVWKTWTPVIKLHLPEQAPQAPAPAGLPLK